MSTIEEQIQAIEKEIRETPYHKGTEHHIGKLRARIARLKDRQLENASRKGGGGGGYSVKKQGDATVVLVGPPSAGKSTLINRLTNAKSKVAPYAFTTVSVIPGMMQYRDTYIQILDVPGLIEGAETGKGRGREVLSVVRGADLLIIISDVKRPEALARITESLETNGIRINKSRPKVLVDKKISGGINVQTNISHAVDKITVKEVASEMGVKNADIIINERLDMERLVDAFSRNRVYVPALYVLNKVDTGNIMLEIESLGKPIGISAETGEGINNLVETIWERLEFLRIYLVRIDEEPSFDNPMVVKRGMSLAEVAESIGTEFAENRKRAKIWGNGAKFSAQEVSLMTKVQEGMQVRFV